MFTKRRKGCCNISPVFLSGALSAHSFPLNFFIQVTAAPWTSAAVVGTLRTAPSCATST